MTGDPARASASGLPIGDGERGVVYYGDNLPILRKIASQSIDLIYTDPPFNTGKKQARTQLRTVRDPSGDRTGFKGQRYRSVKVASRARLRMTLMITWHSWSLDLKKPIGF